jgi:hypothetical protein
LCYDEWQRLVFIDKHLRPILKAENEGNGAYVCSADDIRKAFRESRHLTMINWTAPEVIIYHPQVMVLSANLGDEDDVERWVMPAVSDGDIFSSTAGQS